MCPKIRCDGESEKFCKIFLELNRAYADTSETTCIDETIVLIVWNFSICLLYLKLLVVVV
jgi:hypothetical protein